jgi:hypothetical protein
MSSIIFYYNVGPTLHLNTSPALKLFELQPIGASSVGVYEQMVCFIHWFEPFWFWHVGWTFIKLLRNLIKLLGRIRRRLHIILRRRARPLNKAQDGELSYSKVCYFLHFAHKNKNTIVTKFCMILIWIFVHQNKWVIFVLCLVAFDWWS